MNEKLFCSNFSPRLQDCCQAMAAVIWQSVSSFRPSQFLFNIRRTSFGIFSEAVILRARGKLSKISKSGAVTIFIFLLPNIIFGVRTLKNIFTFVLIFWGRF